MNIVICRLLPGLPASEKHCIYSLCNSGISLGLPATNLYQEGRTCLVYSWGVTAVAAIFIICRNVLLLLKLSWYIQYNVGITAFIQLIQLRFLSFLSARLTRGPVARLSAII